MRQSVDTILGNWARLEEKILFYPKPGNAGDALITAATWQCFDRHGINPVVTHPKQFPEHASVILGGGGNLIPQYRNIANALEVCLERKVARCLLLPHTIRGHEALLRRLDDRFTLLCRDIPSLEHVRQHAPGAIPLLADDMALSLNPLALERRTSTLHHRLSLMLDPDWLKYGRAWRRALARHRPDTDGRLTILRSDGESATTPPGDPDMDLMRHYDTHCMHRAGCDQVAMDTLTLLRRARGVQTDRLHVALPATLLGLEVCIMDNNYGKLTAVWKTSLEDKYPNVRIFSVSQ